MNQLNLVLGLNYKNQGMWRLMILPKNQLGSNKATQETRCQNAATLKHISTHMDRPLAHTLKQAQEQTLVICSTQIQHPQKVFLRTYPYLKYLSLNRFH